MDEEGADVPAGEGQEEVPVFNAPKSSILPPFIPLKLLAPLRTITRPETLGPHHLRRLEDFTRPEQRLILAVMDTNNGRDGWAVDQMRV